jgi:L-seryl-tRNA(Ser) seleniumtransferase
MIPNFDQQRHFNMTDDSRRAIPSVEKVLKTLEGTDLPRSALLAVVRRELARLRRGRESVTFDDTVSQIRSAIDELRQARIQPVINGTGIIIHTNLGRAPLASEAVKAISEIASNYNNLEYDVRRGQRGNRAAYLEHNLAVLCGSDAATVVNNCAAALVLMLRHFTSGDRKEVIISRGELVQIGGGFRIPEILEASGATLREVGTTNKTSLGDYSRAVSKRSAMILKVHRSNFFMGGFVESPTTQELATLASKKRIPLVEDLGSGAVFQTEEVPGIAHEPMPVESLHAGVDLVCFSGDKLFGGPQAGIIAGSTKRIAALKREPFFRALRCDKLVLSALQTTVDIHLHGSQDGDAGHRRLPVIAMMTEANDALQSRAQTLVESLSDLPMKFAIGAGKAQVGGGTLPQSVIPSVTMDLMPDAVSLAEFAARLRANVPPLIGYIAAGRFKIDLRTVFPRQDQQLVAAIRYAFAPNGNGG